MKMSDEYYMRLAIEQAQKAWAIDDVPVGAVIVLDDKVIAGAHNTRELSGKPTAHAEINAINAAAEVVGGWRLIDCTLYVTLEPCPMCAGAAVNSRIKRVVFGAYDQKAGALGTLYNLAEGRLNHTPEVTGGILELECAALLSDYFKEKRNKKSV